MIYKAILVVKSVNITLNINEMYTNPLFVQLGPEPAFGRLGLGGIVGRDRLFVRRLTKTGEDLLLG